jgi:hypothetical protein
MELIMQFSPSSLHSAMKYTNPLIVYNFHTAVPRNARPSPYLTLRSRDRQTIRKDSRRAEARGNFGGETSDTLFLGGLRCRQKVPRQCPIVLIKDSESKEAGVVSTKSLNKFHFSLVFFACPIYKILLL